MSWFKHFFNIKMVATDVQPDLASRRNISVREYIESVIRARLNKITVRGYPVKIGRMIRVKMAHNAKISIGEGCIIDDCVQIVATLPKPELYLGNHVAISFGCIIACKSKLHIGDYTRIGTNVVIRDNAHDYRSAHLLIHTEAIIRPVAIGRNVWIGDKAIINPGVNVGDDAIIGAAAVVSKDVAPGEIVMGNPARVIGKRFA